MCKIDKYNHLNKMMSKECQFSFRIYASYETTNLPRESQTVR